MVQAREKLKLARAALETDVPGQAISPAYYAMLYAARAALSEEDRYAKTHRGSWDLFQRTFVDPGRFDGKLLAEARRQQKAREASDYDAGHFSREEGEAAVELAARFIAAVDRLFAAGEAASA